MLWFGITLSLSLSLHPAMNLYKSSTGPGFSISHPQFTNHETCHYFSFSLPLPFPFENRKIVERRFLLFSLSFIPSVNFFLFFPNELLNPRVTRVLYFQLNYRNMYSVVCTARGRVGAGRGRKARMKYTKGERQTIPVESLNLRNWRAAKS